MEALKWLRSPAARLTAPELALALEIATSVLSHWDMEAASGTAEYNWNAGGIGARPGDRYFASKDAQSVPPSSMAFGAYDDLPGFISDYFGVLALPRYAEALSLLMASPKSDGWIRALRKGGYYSADAEVVAAGWAARRALIVKLTGGH